MILNFERVFKKMIFDFHASQLKISCKFLESKLAKQNIFSVQHCNFCEWSTIESKIFIYIRYHNLSGNSKCLLLVKYKSIFFLINFIK